MTFDLKTWDGFSKLKKDDLDYLLDTTALNKKMAARKGNPYRWLTGSFHVPKGVSADQRKRVADTACGKFVEAMEKQGWKLESKLQVYGPYPALDLLTQVILLDMDEVRIRGIFSTHPKPVRLELDPGMVRQDPEQKSTLQDAIKATGMRPVPRNKRK